MKKYLRVLSLLLIIIVAGKSAAYEACVDGIYYELDTIKKEACVKPCGDGRYQGQVLIPASIQVEGVEYTVTSIGEKAFDNCNRLYSISIPNSVTSIRRGAFSFSGLVAVTIPASVTSLGEHAFEGCNAMSSLIVPEGVGTIDAYAFYACTNLLSLSVPESATNIGWFAFAACSNLSRVTLLTKPSRHIPNVDLELTGAPWSIEDGDTFVSDKTRRSSSMSQLANGAGVLSFEWKLNGEPDYYHYMNLVLGKSNYYNLDGNDACATNWTKKIINLASGNRTLEWYFSSDYGYYGMEPFSAFGNVRTLSFVQGRVGGADVDGTVVGASAFEGCVNLERVDIRDVGAWCGTIFENAWANPLRYAKALYMDDERIENLVIPTFVY